MRFLLCILINSVSSEGNALLLFPHTPLSRPPTSYPVLPCLTQLRKFQPHPRFRSFWRCVALCWTNTVRHSEHPSYTHTDKQESTQGLLSSACLYLQGSVREPVWSSFHQSFLSHLGHCSHRENATLHDLDPVQYKTWSNIVPSDEVVILICRNESVQNDQPPFAQVISFFLLNDKHW